MSKPDPISDTSSFLGPAGALPAESPAILARTVGRGDGLGLEREADDVAIPRRCASYRIRQIGTISRQTHSTTEIHWEIEVDEEVDSSLGSLGLVSLPAGQRFEAITLRDTATDRLLWIGDVIPLGDLPDEAETDAIWQTLPTSRDLPEEDWDKYD